MGWKMNEKPKTILVNKHLITEFVNMEPCPGDRPLSERRLQVYERILRAGEFRPVTWASAMCSETNCTYRVNGKHTSILLSKLTPLPDFYVTVERYYCDKLTDVANLYNTYDSKLGSRTTNDINFSFASTIRELIGIPKRIINLTVSAAAQQKWGDKLWSVSPAERAEELFENTAFAVWLASLVGTGNGNSYILRSPVVAAMIATYNRAAGKAKEFWGLVKEETAPDREDPTRVLARYLVRSSLAGSNSGASTRIGNTKLVGSREMHVKCLHAWNAWRKGERTSLNYHANADVPDVK